MRGLSQFVTRDCSRHWTFRIHRRRTAQPTTDDCNPGIAGEYRTTRSMAFVIDTRTQIQCCRQSTETQSHQAQQTSLKEVRPWEDDQAERRSSAKSLAHQIWPEMLTLASRVQKQEQARATGHVFPRELTVLKTASPSDFVDRMDHGKADGDRLCPREQTDPNRGATRHATSCANAKDSHRNWHWHPADPTTKTRGTHRKTTRQHIVGRGDFPAVRIEC